jgi:phage repressor protein C with HTH and peptisase S24 domain
MKDIPTSSKQKFTQSAIDCTNNKKDAQGKWKAAEHIVSGFTGHHRKPADFVNMVVKEGETAKTLQENAKTIQTHFADEVFGHTSKYDPAALHSLLQLTKNPDLGRPPSFAEINIAVD